MQLQYHLEAFQNHQDVTQSHGEQIGSIYTNMQELQKSLKFKDSIKVLAEKVALLETEMVQRQDQDKEMFRLMKEQGKKMF
jgi:hypothetical protein